MSRCTGQLLRIRFLETPLQRIYGYELYIDLSSLREITLGRSPENTVIIPDPSVSRRHATLCREGNKIILKDLGSRNGTYVVNNHGIYKINEVYISDRVLVRLGLFTVLEIEVYY
ncbi:MAG: FHA domain-containing protein [Crenarchaeota archaeon]|nr:FHA domain-containing protein [Thermoproteota archaeon]